MDRLNSLFLAFICLGAKIISAGWLQSRLERLPPRGEWKLSGGRRSSSAAGLNQPAPCILLLLLICILFLLLICILFLLFPCILSSFRFAYFSSFRFAYSPSGPDFCFAYHPPCPTWFVYLLSRFYFWFAYYPSGPTFDLHNLLQILLFICILLLPVLLLICILSLPVLLLICILPPHSYFWFVGNTRHFTALLQCIVPKHLDGFYFCTLVVLQLSPLVCHSWGKRRANKGEDGKSFKRFCLLWSTLPSSCLNNFLPLLDSLAPGPQKIVKTHKFCKPTHFTSTGKVKQNWKLTKTF